MKFSKLVMTGCVFIAVSGLLFAGGASDSGSKGSGAKGSAKVEKPASISLMVDGTFLIKENGEDILVQGFKDLTGMDLVLNHPIHNQYYEKVNLAFTTGDIPDVVLLGSTYYNTYAINGALYDITSLYDNSDIKKNFKQPIVDALKIDGKLYGLPYDRGNGPITYVRGDWLKKLGLNPPKTFDEYIEMLRQFKNKNPDGLKPEEVIPVTASGLIGPEYPANNYLPEFYQDARPDFIKVNGKWVDGMGQPAMKAALQRMRDAYGEGLIDKEIITNKTSTCRNKFFSGRVGAFTYWAGTWNLNLQKNLTPNIPQGEVMPIPPIKGVKYIERPATAVAITSKAKDPAAIFKYFYGTAFDCGEGQKFFTFGVEGKTYKVEDGLIKFMPSVQDPNKPFVKAWFTPEIPTTNYAAKWDESPLIKNSLEMFQNNSVAYPLPPTSDTMAQLEPELNKIRSAYITKIVYGELSVDDGILQYQKDSAKYTQAIIDSLKK